MSKIWTDEEVEALIDILETKGIATREDNPNLDSRISRNIVKVFESKGYNWYKYLEVALDNYYDYSGVLYNNNMFSVLEVQIYVRKYVLKDDYTG